MKSDPVTRGRCLCGAVSYVFEGPVAWCLHCHCESCRRDTSSPMTTAFGVPRSGFRWTGLRPREYRSSPGVRRLFCGTCGSPIAYESDRYPGEANLYACTLEHPEALVPEAHVHESERLPWIVTADILPRHPHGSD